jgi:ribose transport system permease protein
MSASATVTTPPVEEGTAAGRGWRWGRQVGPVLFRAGSYAVFVGVILLFTLLSPYFLTIGNIGNVLGQSAILLVLATGMTIVIVAGGSNVVTGGIDLSVAANLGLSAAVYATVIQAGFGDGAAIAATLATGSLVGALNAVSVTVIGILPLLATLAVMSIAAGIELVLTQNTAVPVSTDFLSFLSSYDSLGIPVLGYAFIIVAVVFILLVQYTPFGLRLYAAGEFPEAARAAGLPVRRLIAASYVLSGFCGGLGAILSVAYLSGSTTGSGEMLLSIVVTALLGVVFSRRLVPTIGGAVLSALFVGFLINGFQLLNVSSYWVSAVQGALILVVVAGTTLLRRRDVAP